jgi:hypothetical protein
MVDADEKGPIKLSSFYGISIGRHDMCEAQNVSSGNEIQSRSSREVII